MHKTNSRDSDAENPTESETCVCHQFLRLPYSKGRAVRNSNAIIVTCWLRRADVNRRLNKNFLGDFLSRATFKECPINVAIRRPISKGGQRTFGPGRD